MFEEFTKYQILQPFFRKPTQKHQLRQLSRETGLSLPSVKKHVEELKEEGLIEKIEKGTYPGYKASMNEKYRTYKKLETIRKLHETSLINKIEDRFHPNAVVLFGSAAKGEDTEESDIDILVVAGEKDFDTSEYKETFNRKINLQFITEEEINSNKEFANSIANGIVLKGFLKLKR